ncbi:hypothetical protein [Janthinobacterium lividum]|uniref:hypothetical protein n=1 Tax=Janthinobacterium lividum TaxID=29581 RepID=UPI00068E4E70|nr:hypothetical protein [Janthinobacterium lividum]
MEKQFSKSTVADISLPEPSGSTTNWHEVIPQPYFDPKTIVARKADGGIGSLYEDRSWDYSSQSKDGVTAQTLHFWRAPDGATDPTLIEQLYQQHKALVWIIVDRGDIKSFGTLYMYHAVCRDCCTIAYYKKIDLFSLLTDVEEMGAICDTMNEGELNAINGLVQTLWRNRKQLRVSDAEIQRDKIIIKIRAAQAKLPDRKQTPLIPSRIYCSILAGLLDGLDVIERDLDVLLDALSKSINISAQVKREVPQASPRRLAIARGEALAKTADLLRRLGWKGECSKSLQGFIQGKITTYQTHLMHTVAAFSGMRIGEVKILPLTGIIENFQNRGQTHYLIKGYTHKLERGVKKATEWITIEQGHRAIKLAARIGQTVLSLHQGIPQKGQEALLFPSTLDPFRMMSRRPFDSGQKYLINSICPEVKPEDIDELNRLELERGWDRNRIEVGKRWPLAMHQLRRSLSVYAHRSGMVTLPALKAQLQHITDEMRAYYSDGWSRAVNLVFEKDHFSQEWNAAKSESSYFGLTGALQLAFDEEDELLGLGAQRLKQIVSGRSRQQTLALIKSGTIAYRETLLGGCVSTQECKVMPLAPINFECVESNCANVVVRSKRLDLVIRTQESVVAQLNRDDKGSVAQRLEAEHLERMLLARDRLRLSKARTEVTE